MSFQMSVAVRNARLSAIVTTVGTSAKIEIYSGSEPAACSTAASGTKLAEFALASTWMGAPSSGAMTLASLPLTTTGLATGTAGYWRLVATDGTTTGVQGNITATGGGGDMTVDNTSITSGQTVNVTGFTLTEAGA